MENGLYENIGGYLPRVKTDRLMRVKTNRSLAIFCFCFEGDPNASQHLIIHPTTTNTVSDVSYAMKIILTRLSTVNNGQLRLYCEHEMEQICANKN